MVFPRLSYYRRVAAAYVLRRPSQLTFWHEVPELNERAEPGELGEYWMTFRGKADYPGPYDAGGIPLLNYHGAIGLQYNPIAVAQYGLGNYNLFARTGDRERLARALAAADWLAARLEPNRHGVPVWHHHFDWEYRTLLRAPWYSGLAQGQGISLLVRAFQATGQPKYVDAAAAALRALTLGVDEGGVAFRNGTGDVWFEEYLVDPPSHILNGFVWASWGVYDYALLTGDAAVRGLFESAAGTMLGNLHRYDVGYWSLYELSPTRVPMLASPFYHRLHVVQLHVMFRLTGRETFRQFAERWSAYASNPWSRRRALVQKAIFKALYY
ncbi:MAG TPA: D-glucuronyl C5-epimerase family protein [Vicinamibacterales bacterium]|nr:D-glucuronyl C5-epimerase family protein [Vicinamibacterales bacterium]